MLILVDSFLNIKNINVSVYSKKHNIEYIIFFNDILLFFLRMLETYQTALAVLSIIIIMVSDDNNIVIENEKTREK